MPVTTIIFDLGGVLVQTRWERFTRPVGEMCGLPEDAVMDRVTSGDAYFPFMRGEFDADEFARRLAGGFALDGVSRGNLLSLWSDVIVADDGSDGQGDVFDIVTRLRGRYRLAIGSNTDPLHFARGLELRPSLHSFQDRLLSYELGRCKPDPDFFILGLRTLGIRADECVFIDDRPDNVAAARGVGIEGVHFISAIQLEADLTALQIL